MLKKGFIVLLMAICSIAHADVVLEGQQLKLAFSSEDFHVTSFVGRGKFGEISAPTQTGDNALWRIELASNRGRLEEGSEMSEKDQQRESIDTGSMMSGLSKNITVTAKDECEKSYKIEKMIDGVRIRLFWKGLDLEDEKDVLDVTATAWIPNKSDLAFWKLQITNRSKVYGIWHYYYPCIEIAPPDADLEKNFFVNTYRMGQVINDPFHVQPDKKGRRLYNDRRTLYTGANAKGGQFIAFYGGNGRGFFYSSRDTIGWEKRFGAYFYPKNPCTRFELRSVPLNMGYPSEDFAMEFPVVAGFFKGDWYDVSQLYRKWAVKQSWCRKGPVAGRKDIPQWLKDCIMVPRMDTEDDVGGRGLEFVSNSQTYDNLKNVLRCIELFGKDAVSVWYSWWVKDKRVSAADEEFLSNSPNGNDGQFVVPIPAVLEVNHKIQAAGGHTMAYINGVIYDFGDTEDFKKAKHAATRNLLGELYIGKGDPQACLMCGHAKWWQERFAGMCVKAVKDFGFNGVYWDSYGKDGYRCFATNHGHSYGGGTKWIQGERESGLYVRKAMKEANPEAVVGAEESSEEFIDIVDQRLCLVVLHEYAAPIYSAIYHDYQLFYGRNLRGRDADPFFSMSAAYLFNAGGQLGRYFVDGKGIDFDEPKNADKLRFFTKLVNAKRSAREFLNLGRMMRPPKMLSDVPTLTTRHNWYPRPKRVGKNQDIVTLPKVICSAWKSAESEGTPQTRKNAFGDPGEVAVVFVNWSTKSIKFTYQIDTAEYGFTKGTKISRFNLTDSGREPISPLTSGIYQETIELPAPSVKIIVLKGK